MVAFPRSEAGKPNELVDVPEHDFKYFVAWAVSGVMALAAVLAVWHFDL